MGFQLWGSSSLSRVMECAVMRESTSLFFQDTMVKGLLRSYRHDHFFRALSGDRTEMRDVLWFSMPFWLLGVLSERVVMRSRLTMLLKQRNQVIKETAEASK